MHMTDKLPFRRDVMPHDSSEKKQLYYESYEIVAVADVPNIDLRIIVVLV